MFLTITTPDKTICQNREVDAVFVKTDDGPIGILDHHASLVTTTSSGSMRVVADHETDTYTLRNATLRVDNPTNSLTILALSCIETSEQTELDMSNYLDYLNQALSDPSLDKSSLRYKFLEGERISVVKKT